MSNYAPSTSAGSPSHSSDAQSDSATILAFLKKIDASNEALARHVQKQIHHNPRLAPMQTGTFATTHTRAGASSLASQLRQPGSQQATTAMNSYTGGPNAIQDATQHFTDEGVMPDINVLRQNPQISQTVSQMLSAYDSQARHVTGILKEN